MEYSTAYLTHSSLMVQIFDSEYDLNFLAI